MEKLILVDLNPQVCAAFERYFENLPNVEIFEGYFEQLREYDCFVSAANSFGLMDGGVDAAITRFFGEQLMRRVQENIIEQYFGEQPVGTSMIVETGAARFPYLAHTPTMRVPMAISRTDHVYLAMWAMLRAVHQHNQTQERQIKTVACPGLGTGVGKMSPNEAARQMALAYHNYLNPPAYINWGFASERQAQIRYGGDLSYNFPNA
ncbi:MAG: macro domain-containing protein [Anaerolineae bacterium]